MLMATAILCIGFSQCSDEPKNPTSKERLILIYAIAANNLENNLKLDMGEMLEAAPGLDLTANKLLVYSVDNTAQCTLKELKKGKKGYEFSIVADFPELPLSTSEERISDVIKYIASQYNYEKKGLILWSHSDGWLPWFAGSNPANAKKKSFGWDNYEGATYKTNITTLAEAIPGGVFDFIWFDCCYMANIETVYQLRDKTDYIVGSVLEIHEDGMPYNLTLPCLLKKNADLKGAAQAFFQYYDEDLIPVSISIMKTSYMPQLAATVGEIFREGTVPSNLSNIQTYQRYPITQKFYDMGELLRSYQGVSPETFDAFNEMMDEVVEYKLISYYDFNRHPIKVNQYSGLSMHNYQDKETSDEMFYRELDWYKATR